MVEFLSSEEFASPDSSLLRWIKPEEDQTQVLVSVLPIGLAVNMWPSKFDEWRKTGRVKHEEGKGRRKETVFPSPSLLCTIS